MDCFNFYQPKNIIFISQKYVRIDDRRQVQFDDTESIFWHASTEPDMPAKDGSSRGEVQEYSGYSWRGQILGYFNNIKMFAKKQQCMPLPESVQARNGRLLFFLSNKKGTTKCPPHQVILHLNSLMSNVNGTLRPLKPLSKKIW